MRSNVTVGVVLMALSTLVVCWGMQWPLTATDWQVLWHLRLPQVLVAISVGAALSVSAAMLQVVLKNPLADPGFIGITSGASLCAALFMLTPLGVTLWFGLPLFAFTGALMSTAIIYWVASRVPVAHGVILAGIGLSALSGAIIAWLYWFSAPMALKNLSFWLMGSLHQATLWESAIAALIILPCLAMAFAQGRALNLLYFPDALISSRGVDAKRLQRRVLILAAVLVGAAVAVAGSVAFVGLLVPHVLRLKYGHDNRQLLPLSALAGACLMVGVLAIEHISASGPLPLSMLTASLGAPLLVLFLLRGQAQHA